MTAQLKQTLAELVAMAKDGNRHAVPTLNQILDVTTDRNDRQQVELAIRHASRPAKPAPKAVPTINPAVFEMPAETRALWAIVTAASRN